VTEKEQVSVGEKWIASRLGLPNVLQDAIKGPVEFSDLNLVADRVVFDQDVSNILLNLIENNQIELPMIYQTVRLPSKAVWIEWRWHSPDDPTDDPLKMGILFEQGPEYIGVGAVAGGRKKEPRLVGITRIKTLPMIKDSYQLHDLYIDNDLGARIGHSESKNTLKDIVIDALFGLFLLQQPKVHEKVKVEYGPKLQKKRVQLKKLPLIDYQRVNVIIGSPVKEYERSGESVPGTGGGGKKRYHKVLGHFRIYQRNTPEAYVIWVDDFWRGDPRLGVVLKEHHAVVDKNANLDVQLPRKLLK
jgi:hypothetical protein